MQLSETIVNQQSHWRAAIYPYMFTAFTIAALHFQNLLVLWPQACHFGATTFCTSLCVPVKVRHPKNSMPTEKIPSNTPAP